MAHAAAPPSAFADVPALSIVAPTSQCTITAATAKQEDALGRGAVVNTVTPATQSVDQSSTTNQLSTVNQTPSVSHSSKVASSANPTLPTSVVFKQLTQPLLITDLQAGKIISHTLKGFVRSITGTQLRIWPRI